MRTYKALIGLLFMLAPLFAESQRSIETFGQNRVQYKSFKWKFITTANFNIYYYEGGNKLAHNAARYAEADFERITRTLGYVPPSKTTIIVYNSIADLQQSNLGLSNNMFIGGETNLIKSKLEIAFTGDQISFKQEITRRVSELFVNLLMFGGNLKDMVQNSYLMELPNWFLPGIARYLAEGWSPEMEDVVKDFVIDKPSDPAKLLGEEAPVIGQSIWHYINTSYGRQNVSSILNLTRILRNEETSIANTLGVSYPNFLEDWKNYYIEKLAPKMAGEIVPDKSNRLRRFNRRSVVYNDIIFNPDSSVMAYSENYHGRFAVFVYNLETEKRKCVYRGGMRVINQDVDYNYPLLAWKTKDELAIFSTKQSRPYLVTKDLHTRKKEKKKFVTFDAVLGFDYSETKDFLVLSAARDGRSDLFLYAFKLDRAFQLTDDLYDDLHPRFVDGTHSIVFSSNRITDTLKSDFGKYYQMDENHDIFVMELINNKTANPILNRLTYTDAAEHFPRFTDEEHLYYLQTEGTRQSIMRQNVTTQEVNYLTNFNRSLHQFDLLPEDHRIAYTLGSKNKEYIYLKSDYDPEAFLKSEYITPVVEKAYLDTSDVTSAILTMDINDFSFESSPKKNKKEKDALGFTVPPRTKIYGPNKYRGLFGADHVVSSVMIDPLRGMGVVFDVDMSEMFGDHRLNTQMFLLTDLKSSSFSGRYDFLKRRQDFSLFYDKMSVFAFSETAIQRYNKNTFEATVSHPFSPAARIELTGGYLNTRFTDFNNIRTNDIIYHYTFARSQFVFDNTLEHGLNMLEGTRVKASVGAYQNWSVENLGFTRFNIDARNYTRVFKDFVLATRFATGGFRGNGRTRFLLGGMDNWLFSSSEFSGDDDPLNVEPDEINNELLFLEYATNLRGFKFNKQNGNSFMLLNVELRLPVVRIVTNGNISSKFLRNLQALAFYDLGSAWNGPNPFNENNSINTVNIQGSGFNAQVTNYENAFLSSYGLGLRSMLWGYYAKLDVAWGIENYTVLSPRVYLSLGYDF